MAEQHTLTTPITQPAITTYRVARIVLDWDAAVVDIVTVDSGGHRVEHRYTGSTATGLMVQLNKANLSVNSLHKRALQRLVADGLLGAGVVTGSPD